MIQTDYCPDKFGTYLSHPESLGGGIDLSDSSVREIILAYRAYRRTLERVRDMFVLLCNLGQRYSDIRRISPENFERNLFRIIQQKTGNKAVVDIDRYAIFLSLHTHCSRNTATAAHTPAPCQTTTVIYIHF